MSKRFPLLKEFAAFITERQHIHELRCIGAEPPWTKDEILRTYRFTNVRREDDRVTRWIHKEWVAPNEHDGDRLVFAMCLARLVNLPATLALLDYPMKWDAARFVRIMDKVRASGNCAYNNAYMINAVGATKGQSKASYLAECVLTPMWKQRSLLQGKLTLRELHEQLLTFHGFGGGFMAAQVVADVKWAPAWRVAPDWHTFACSGPGSRRGLGWLCFKEPTLRWNEAVWQSTLVQLRGELMPLLPAALQDLDAQNLQNACCEFSKWCKVKYLDKRAKQKFKPSEESYG
jgi:hypothetical protein